MRSAFDTSDKRPRLFKISSTAAEDLEQLDVDVARDTTLSL